MSFITLQKFSQGLIFSCTKKKGWLGMIKKVIEENIHFNNKWKLVMNEQWMTGFCHFSVIIFNREV